MYPPATPTDVVERFRSLIPLHIRYQLENCPTWNPAQAPSYGQAGNCTIAAIWAAGESILQPLNVWLNSSGIVTDALTAGGKFTRIERAAVGCFIGFPWKDGNPGHFGVVSEVGLDGRATRVIHCSPSNGRNDSVRETTPERFYARADCIYAWLNKFPLPGQTQAPPVRPAAPAASSYTPPAASAALLGAITGHVRASRRLAPPLAGLEYMCRLPNALFFQSDLDLCTDGVRDPKITGYDRTHLDKVSIGQPVNANATPYVVLPTGFAKPQGLVMGNVCAVIHGSRIEFAVYCENGPAQKIGEGSIALHRSLGHETVIGGKVRDSGIPGGVITIVFAGTGNGRVQTPDAIRAIGRERFIALGGVLP